MTPTPKQRMTVENPIPWPYPTPKQLASKEFEVIWQVIKRWDISVPDAYSGYCGATGNHVAAILSALKDCFSKAHAEGYEAGVCFGLTDAGYDKGYADAIADAEGLFLTSYSSSDMAQKIRALRPKEK